MAVKNKNKPKLKKQLTIKQSNYIKERNAGKNKKQAGLDAGYSENTVIDVKNNIEKPILENHGYTQLIDTYIPVEAIFKTIQDGLQATLVFQGVNGLTESNLPDHRVRIKTAELAGKFRGSFIEKHEHTINHNDWSNELVQKLGEKGYD
jgi:hypothetical protein